MTHICRNITTPYKAVVMLAPGQKLARVRREQGRVRSQQVRKCAHSEELAIMARSPEL